MCGVAGFIDLRAETPSKNLNVLAGDMAKSLDHRGPDDSGVWTDAEAGVALAHSRLSVRDLSDAGRQPMLSFDERYVLVYNGEIYDMEEMRAGLEGRGVRFRGLSDTEVLLNACACYGVAETLNRLNGMFAFALWDRRDRTLHLARDRLGEKPLYYGWVGGDFVFASEIKALRAHPRWRGEVDRGALTLLLRHNYIPAPHSIYQGIHKLLPGHWLTVPAAAADKPEGVRTAAYWSARAVAEAGVREPFRGTAQEAADGLEALLRDAVRLRMEADVPVGAFLSGGVDSSMVVALMQQECRVPVRTFSIGFHEAEFNEAHYAKAVAAHLGTEHTELYVTPQEAMQVIPRLPELFDEPFADSSQIPTFLVSEMTRRHVTVSLSGDGGDELFGGYDTFADIPRMVRVLGAVPGLGRFGRRLRAATAPLFRLPGIARALSPKWAGLLELGGGWGGAYLLRRGIFMPWELAGLLGPEMAADGLEALQPLIRLDRTAGPPAATAAKMSALEISWYMQNQLLRDSDWAGMAHGLEIRVPLVDEHLFRRLAPAIATGAGPSKSAMAATPARPLPDGVLNRPKTGFQVPVRKWMLSGGESTGNNGAAERGFRGWAKTVYRAQWKDGLPVLGR